MEKPTRRRKKTKATAAEDEKSNKSGRVLDVETSKDAGWMDDKIESWASYGCSGE